VSSPQSERPKVGALTLERIEAGRAWLERTPDDRWFIQLFATDASRHGEIEALLRRLAPKGTELNNVHVYYSELSGKARYGVIYGDYPSREEASAALRNLPQVFKANKPYPRQVLRLR